MKKLLLTIISITIALFTLAGCTVQENPNSMQDNSNANNNSIVQDNQSNNETTKTEVITLTKENFEQYFNVNAYTSDFYETKSYVFGMYEYDCSCNLNINISKSFDFEIKDVKITFQVFSAWDYIQGVHTEDYSKYIDLTLPISGTVNKVYRCSGTMYSSQASSTPSTYLSAVEGTIIVTQ